MGTAKKASRHPVYPPFHHCKPCVDPEQQQALFNLKLPILWATPPSFVPTHCFPTVLGARPMALVLCHITQCLIHKPVTEYHETYNSHTGIKKIACYPAAGASQLQQPTCGLATLPKKDCPICVSRSSLWNAATRGRWIGCWRLTCNPLRLMLISCTPRTSSGLLSAASKPARPGHVRM